MKIGITACLIIFPLLFTMCAHRGKNFGREIKSLAEKSGGTVAVAFEDLVTGKTYFLNGKMQMHAASTMKTPVMIEAFRQANSGKFNLDDSITIYNEFHSIVDGSPYRVTVEDDSDEQIHEWIGKKMSIRDLVHRMITMSSNLATNIVIDLVGAQQVMATMREIGAPDMQILRGVEDIKAFQQDLNNTTNAHDMLQVMKAIALKKVAACDQMIGILLNQQHRKGIPRWLPEQVRVANKTGSITGIKHDAAIVWATPDHPYVLVIMTKGIEDQEKAETVIANISKACYDEVLR